MRSPPHTNRKTGYQRLSAMESYLGQMRAALEASDHRAYLQAREELLGEVDDLHWMLHSNEHEFFVGKRK